MKTRELNALAQFREVQGFLDRNALILPTPGAAARCSLDDVIEALLDAGRRQSATETRLRAATRAIGLSRIALIRDHMRPLVLAARAFDCAPQLANTTFLRAGKQMTSLLCADAAAMMRQAEPHTAALIAAGLAPNFLDAMRDAIDRLHNAVVARDVLMATRVGATCAVHVAVARGQGVIRFLDALLKAPLDGHAALTAEWHASKRAIGRSSRVQIRPDAVASGAA